MMAFGQEESCRAERLRGLRVLVVEDDYLMARWLTSQLEDWGCNVIGPVASADLGQRVARSKPIDAALLDINLRGEHSGPVADALDARGVPFLFVTGYASPQILPSHLLSRPRLLKPIDERELCAAIVRRLDERVEGQAGPPPQGA